MKKILIIILTFFLVLPFHVYATESVEYYDFGKLPNVNCTNYQYAKYATEVYYEDGKYHLTGTITEGADQYLFNSDVETLYTCYDYNLECEKVYVVLNNTNCSFNKATFQNLLAFQYQNGNTYEDTKYYYIGSNYTYENGVYTLVDYTKHDIKEIRGPYYISNKYKGKYLCAENMGITCTKLYRIEKEYNTRNASFYSAVNDIESYILISNQYKKENGKYTLINPKKIYPSADIGESGFTCKSKENNCSELYKIVVDGYYEVHYGGRRNYVTHLETTEESKSKTINIKDSYDVTEFFSTTELNTVFSTDPDIANIKNNKLELYKAGKTDIIYEDDFNYKVLHLTVTKDRIFSNPKTAANTIIAIVIGLTLIIVLSISKKKNLL